MKQLSVLLALSFSVSSFAFSYRDYISNKQRLSAEITHGGRSEVCRASSDMYEMGRDQFDAMPIGEKPKFIKNIDSTHVRVQDGRIVARFELPKVIVKNTYSNSKEKQKEPFGLYVSGNISPYNVQGVAQWCIEAGEVGAATGTSGYSTDPGRHHSYEKSDIAYGSLNVQWNSSSGSWTVKQTNSSDKQASTVYCAMEKVTKCVNF